MKRPSIISLGEVLWDVFPNTATFGGAPANFACHAAIQGGNVAMISAVGNDHRGREAIKVLTGFGLDVSLVRTVSDAPTGTVDVQLDEHDIPTYTIHEGSAWDKLSLGADLTSRIASADAIYFGTLGQRSLMSRDTIRKAAAIAAASGIVRILDVNLRPPFYDAAMIRDSVQLASILKLSDDELPEVRSACGVAPSEEPADMLSDLLEFADLDLAVMTRGAKGALLVTPDGTISHDGVPAVVTDTVGAGDSFAAAFLVSELQGASHQDSIRKACSIAAETCSHSGAVPSEQSTNAAAMRSNRAGR